MKNIILSIDDKLVEASREYARKRNTSLNALVRNILEEKISLEKRNWIVDTFALMDNAMKAKKNKTLKWKREELYDV